MMLGRVSLFSGVGVCRHKDAVVLYEEQDECPLCTAQARVELLKMELKKHDPEHLVVRP
jgi:hypothetical protein